jgi:hypothetical protein
MYTEVTKLEVVIRLSEWFPSIAKNLNIDRIRDSENISIFMVQLMFWEQVRSQIDSGEYTAKSILIEDVKRSLPKRPSADLLLHDLIFLSHV